MGSQLGNTQASAAGLPRHWFLLEQFFARLYGVQPLGPEPDHLFAFNLRPHGESELRLRCGTRVGPGDTVMELHFRREGLAPLAAAADPASMGMGLLLLADREVPRLAAALENDPRLAGVTSLHALTLFHRGIRRYGFEVMPLEPRLHEWWFTWWQLRLLVRDHPHGRGSLPGGLNERVVRRVWISRQELLRRYGRNGTRRGAQAAG